MRGNRARRAISSRHSGTRGFASRSCMPIPRLTRARGLGSDGVVERGEGTQAQRHQRRASSSAHNRTNHENNCFFVPISVRNVNCKGLSSFNCDFERTHCTRLLHPRRRFGFSPQREFTWGKTRIWLRLADLSRILVGTFFREVHPASEMGGQNGQNGLFCQNDQNDQNGLVF